MSKRPQLPTTHERLLHEANDPRTPGARLSRLALHRSSSIARLAILNPSLPTESWREHLLKGEPEAWDNPQTPVGLMAWSGKPLPSVGARKTFWSLRAKPERCSQEGCFWIDKILDDWWKSSLDPSGMLSWCHNLAFADGEGSERHRALVRLHCLCARTAPEIWPLWFDVLAKAESWTRGEETKESVHDAITIANKQTGQGATSSTAGSAVYAAANMVNISFSGESASLAAIGVGYASGAERDTPEWDAVVTKHRITLANLIRREIPDLWR